MKFEISYWEMVAAITLIWVIVRGIAAVKNKGISPAREAKLLLVYVCFLVVSRMVNFPLHHVDGKIAPMVFDSARILPFWLNLVPIVHLFEIYDGWQINIIGNITMFIPVGIIWPACFEKLDTMLKATLAGVGFTLFIEVFQLLFYDRCSDIDDIILNSLGFVIGAGVYFACSRKSRAGKKTDSEGR